MVPEDVAKEWRKQMAAAGKEDFKNELKARSPAARKRFAR